MTRETRSTILLITALWIAAAALLLYAMSLGTSGSWSDFLIFLCVATLAELWFVYTSRESGMSLSFTVHFAAAVLFGPAFAMIVALAGLLIADGLIRRRPAVRTSFNMAQMAIAVGLCGLVFQRLSPGGQLNLVADFPALAVSAFVYLLMNDTLVAVVLSIRGRSFFQEWKLSMREILLPYISMAPLGALVAYTYQTSPWTLVFFTPLVLVIYNGFKLFVNLQRETDDALVALADSIDRRDQYTYQHSQRVAAQVGEIARHLGLPARKIDLIVAAARVHDLGKIGTDNSVLLKPSSLTPDERLIIQAHSADGEELAGKFSMFREGRRFIRHHHERWDGKGYPDGLAGTHIPLGARIITVADCYDAMTSDRPYRKALPPDIAIIELRRCAGTQFDAQVVEAFLAAGRERPEPALHLVPQAQESCSS
jgi:putative nucleotidyltransferase with HDIG domain